MSDNIDRDFLALAPTRNPDFEFDDEYLIHVREPQKTLFVNGSTALIWGQCDGETTIGEMIRTLADAFPDDAAGVSADVVAAVLMMAERGVVKLN